MVATTVMKMPLVLIQMVLLSALVTTASLEMELPAMTLTSVLSAIIVTRTRHVLTPLAVSSAAVILDIQETAPAVLILMNVQKALTTVIQVYRLA